MDHRDLMLTGAPFGLVDPLAPLEPPAAPGLLSAREFDANDPANEALFQELWRTHVEFEEGHWGADATPYAAGELRTTPEDTVRRYDHFVAERDGRVVGMGLVVRRMTENHDLATVVVGARGDGWRSGALPAVIAEMDRVERERGLHRFAFSLEVPMDRRDQFVTEWTEHGWELYSEGRRLDLDLPDDAAREAATAPQAPFPEGYELVLSKDMPDEQLRHEQCPLREAMFWDDERGGLAVERRRFDEPRVRRFYEINLRAGRRFWTAMARCAATGKLVGYSDLTTTGIATDHARQEDTFVLPAHRRRGIGLALKRATLRELLKDRPDIGGVRTWTALANRPMMRVNQRMGFVDRGADLNLLHRL